MFQVMKTSPSFQPEGRGLGIGKNFELSGNIRGNIDERERGRDQLKETVR